MRRASPIRLITTVPRFGKGRFAGEPIFGHDEEGKPKEHSEWMVMGPLRVAQFRHRRYSNVYAILHPSTRIAGWWQLSRFDADGPTGHDQAKTATDALKEGLYGRARDWKLEEYA